MTQPPDEQPTVAWTPPEEPPVAPEPAAPVDPTSGPAVDPAAPAAPAPSADPPPAMPPPVTEPTTTPMAPPAGSTPADPGTAPSDAGQSPLISWAPSAGAAGAASAAGTDATPDGTPAQPGQPGPIVGWESPSAAQPPSAVAGYQVAGVGSRIVAWLLDIAIIAILSGLVLFVLVLVAPDTFTGDSFASSAMTAILTTGLSFLYFVGQWTGGRGATLGMRSVGIRVVEAPGPRPLAIGPAVVRWAAFGYPLTFLALIPVLGSVVSWALTGWTIVLLLTTAMSDTNQGLHDRFAGSAVLRRIGAGSGWAVIGCVGLIALFFIGLILLPIIALATLSPDQQDQFWNELLRQMELEMERQS